MIRRIGSYSYLRASAGFFLAARQAWPLTVNSAITSAAPPARKKAAAGIEVRKGNSCSHDLKAK
jgi:hypothetical protein